MIFGCDEAGKGPVIGSMFVSCVYGDGDRIPDDVRDSKKLSTNRIFELSDLIKKRMKFNVVEVKPDEIDSSSMTELSNSAFTESIQSIDHRSCSKGYIDCYINNTETVESALTSNLDLSDKTELVVEFGADENYDIVSAASIISKAHREMHISNISDRIGDVGSGYPSDQKTRNFLIDYIEENGEAPNVARDSWSTTQDLLEEYKS